MLDELQLIDSELYKERRSNSMSTNYNRLINNLEALHLSNMALNISDYLGMIANGSKTPVDALYELTEKECIFQREKAIKSCVKTAGFPFEKTLKDFDFAFQPSINKEEMEDYASLRFLENNENILFIGSSGTGKTHLATSIGIEAAKNRYSVHYIAFHDLINELKKAEMENRLEKRIKAFVRYKLLIIDEIGYLNYDKNAGNLFFQLISKRYEQRSTIVTSNRSLAKWGEIFGDAVIANAILDRLLYHSHIVNIVGPSYRTKDIMESLNDSDN